MFSPKTQTSKQLETFFNNDFANKPQELPSMKDLIEYCERYPRLLTLRDSPLKDLHDPNIPMVMAHDWYISEAIIYIEEEVKDILNKWMDKNKIIFNDTENSNKSEQLGNLIDQLYMLYERIHMVPNMQLSEDSPMLSPHLKLRLDQTFSAILDQLLPTSIKKLQRDYYIYIYNQLFSLTPEEIEKEEENDDDDEDDNDYEKEIEKEDDEDSEDDNNDDIDNDIFAPRQYTKNYHFKNKTLMWISSRNLDKNLPVLVDVYNIPDKILKNQVTKIMKKYEGTVSDAINDSVTFENPSDQQQQYQGDDDHIMYNINGEDINYMNHMNENDDDIEMDDAHGVPSNPLTQFIDICQKSYILRLLPPLEEIIENWIHQRFLGVWEEEWSRNVLQIQLNWFRRIVLPWLSHILAPPPSFVSSDNVNPWYRFLKLKIKMEYKIYNEFYQSRIANIFGILLEYPSSLPALKDLKVVVKKTNQMEGLRDAIIESLNKRLLHQGASAIDIIQQYITCIKCLKMFDPSCQLLFPVVELVEQYMITYRHDVAHGVLEVIRNSKDYDLDLSGGHCYVFAEGELDRESVPLYEHIAIDRLRKKVEDLIAMLISLCGSVNSFIEGYQEILGQSLLMAQNYDIEHEMFYLENIKQRFPQNTLIGCDIMIKDIEDGRRLDRQIHEASDNIDSTFHSFILSKNYWPEIGSGEIFKLVDNDDIPIPSNLKKSMPLYEEEFKMIKQSRNLQWLPSHGSVTIELEFENRTAVFTVKPTDALVIDILSKEEQLDKQQIMERTGLNGKLVMKSLNYWYKNGIIEQSNGKFKVIEEAANDNIN
ncbi:hypothetical protein BJ944DRAFT_251098, partial [Cunninghamella echinulata]